MKLLAMPDNFTFNKLLVRIVDDFIAKRLTLYQEDNELCKSIRYLFGFPFKYLYN